MHLVRRWRNALVALSLALTVLFTGVSPERYGDNLQIALPLTGLACALATGGAVEYAGRFTGMWLTVRASKELAGDAAFNRRPNDKRHGFPSGHTSAAAFGASSLVHSCIERAPLLKAAVVVAAGFVGGSRISTEQHNIWQVLAGAVIAVVFERLFRDQGIGRRRIAAMARRTGRTVRRPFSNRK